MKLQCEQTSLRLRLTENEYQQLGTERKIEQAYPYLPLQIIIRLHDEATSARLTSHQLQLDLTSSDYHNIASSEQRKNGLPIWLTYNDGEMVLELQLDTHPTASHKTKTGDFKTN